MRMIIPVRASSIAAFFDCPARWVDIHIDGNMLPSTPPACIGTAVHFSTAVFDKAILSHEAMTPTDAAEFAVEYIKHPDEEVRWGDVRQEKAIDIALGVHTRYCNEIAPHMHYVKIEETLQDMEIDIDDVTIVLSGTMDRLRTVNGHYGVNDVKTGARAMSTNAGKHKAQVGAYSLLAENHFGFPITLPEEIIALQTSSNYQAGVKPVEHAREALLGTDEEDGLLDSMAKMLKSGIVYGNSSSWLCSEKYCPKYHRCKYK